MPATKNKQDLLAILRIVGTYAVFGSLWIYLSDSALGLLVRNPDILTRFAIFKGLLFIILTSALLYLLITRFIDKHRRAEVILRQSEEKFSTAFRASPDAVTLTRVSDGAYLDVNDGFCNITGYNHEEAIGSSVLGQKIWVAPHERDQLIRDLNISGQVKDLEAEFRRKDGTTLTGQVSACTISINNETYILGITRDITRQKQAELALRKSEESLKSLMELMPVGIFWVDKEGRIDYQNRYFSERFGYAADEISTLNDWFMQAYPDPVYRATLDSAWKRTIEKAVSAGTALPPAEARVTCRDGSICPTIVNTLLSHNHILAIFTDITEHENLQRELLKIQKLESLGVLAGGIAHDFNNILTGIMGNISFARMLMDEPQRASAILLEAEKACQRASDLAHQLLTFAKGGQPVRTTVSTKQIIAASASLVLHGSNVSSNINIPDNLYAIEADEGQLSQVFNNLIINAAQSMPGGGSISIHAENIKLDGTDIMSLPAGEYVRVTISDTGCGISEEDQKKIFDPYFTTKPGGSGLGLASVHSIVSKHDGHISVSSNAGKGTTFTILLPASSRKAPEPKTVETAPVPVMQSAGHSLLVMDDEEMIRDLSIHMLAELGYQVQTCVNGEEAIELYNAAREQGIPFSAVIMDLTIPGGMGGKEAANHILNIDPQARLIVSSGYSNDPVMADFARYGFCAAIVKPYDVNDMALKLLELLA